MNYEQLPIAEVYRQLSASEEGLSTAQAAERHAKYGDNKLKEGKPIPLIRRILTQLTDPMVLILLAAATISALFAGEEGRADVFVILAVVVLNTLLGVVQESKAEAALRALREMTPDVCHVIRGGKAQTIPASSLVPGDLVLIEAGSAIPADGRLVEACSLRVEQAALTGEAHAVEKDTAPMKQPAPPSEQTCMAFLGSCAVYGRGKMLVTRIGMDTEMGKIASSLSGKRDPTPLQKKLAALSRTLTALVLAICALTFLVGWWKEGEWTLDAALRSFLLAVSLAVAAIPEGMVAVVTVVLSMGVSRMAKRRAIIRKLPAVETLGCTGVICSDKTGTLTQNRMTVARHHGPTRLLAVALALCNDAGWDQSRGDPTELALIAFARSQGFTEEGLCATHPRIGEIPFDSERKRMSTFHRTKEGIVQFTKGAPDSLLTLSSAYVGQDGIPLPMTESMRAEIRQVCHTYASSALRIIAAAYRPIAILPVSPTPEAQERDLIFIGLVGMIDPVRPEVPDAISLCREAGIRVVMITGDHPDTARAIAAELGILRDGTEILTGDALNGMDDERLRSEVSKISVFARVQPEHKTRIVAAWKANGPVTAMTGDGVNDAPALKQSDIGIGMGLTGTDVTKGCADIILADDNFATIVCAVEEGRRIWENVCKAIHFLLSSNFSEVLVIFFATICGIRILSPIHLLFINLITDSLPALALGMEQAERDIMHRPPRDSSEGVFAHGALGDILFQGSAAAMLTGLAFLLGAWFEGGGGNISQTLAHLRAFGSPIGCTMAFLSMALAETFHSFNMRSRTASVFTLRTKNRWLTLAILSSIAITAALIFLPPITALFGLEQISLSLYLLSMVLAAMMIPIVEIAKAIKRRKAS